jgi:hypothetical protein
VGIRAPKESVAESCCKWPPLSVATAPLFIATVCNRPVYSATVGAKSHATHPWDVLASRDLVANLLCHQDGLRNRNANWPLRERDGGGGTRKEVAAMPAACLARPRTESAPRGSPRVAAGRHRGRHERGGHHVGVGRDTLPVFIRDHRLTATQIPRRPGVWSCLRVALPASDRLPRSHVPVDACCGCHARIQSSSDSCQATPGHSHHEHLYNLAAEEPA